MPPLDLLANPNLAIVLLTVGFLALLAALARLGELVFGTLGAVLIAAGAAGLAHLPLHLLWLVPLAAAAGLLAAEVCTDGRRGPFAAGGALLMVAAGSQLFAGQPASALVLWLAALLAAGGAVLLGSIARGVREAVRARVLTGREGLVGRRAVVERARGRTGQVRLDGTWWTVRSRDGVLRRGALVEVVDLEGLHLIVTRAGGEPAA